VLGFLPTVNFDSPLKERLVGLNTELGVTDWVFGLDVASNDSMLLDFFLSGQLGGGCLVSFDLGQSFDVVLL